MKKRLIILALVIFTMTQTIGQNKKKSTSTTKSKISQKSTKIVPTSNPQKSYEEPKTLKQNVSTSSGHKYFDGGAGDCFHKGNNIADLGVGFSGYGIPVHFGAEHFFTDDISGGVTLNYSSYSPVFSSYTWTFIYGGPKVNYHFNRLLELKNNKADLYAGVTLGYWYGTSNIPYYGLNSYGGTVYYGLQVGGRYYFSKNLGVYAELGGGNVSGATVGLTLKF